jgi:hypothetical protein
MFANHRAAKFSTRDLQVAQIPVLVSGDSVLLLIQRADPSGAALLEDKDFTYLPVSANGSRHIPLGIADLRTRTPANPFGSIRAEVVAPAGKRVVSNREPSTTSNGVQAGMDLMPQRDAFLVIDDASLLHDADEPVPAMLVSFLTPTLSGDRDQLGRVVDDIEGKLIDPVRLAELRTTAARTVADAQDSRTQGSSRRTRAGTPSQPEPPLGSPVAPPLDLGGGFGDGFDDTFGSPSDRTSGGGFGAASSAPPGAPPAAPPPQDAGDAAWGSGPSGSDDIWD